MAKTQAQAASKGPKALSEINLKAFLPEGFSEKDFDIVGGLRPICSPESMLDPDSPVVGWVVALLDMPNREDGSEWRALLVELTGNATAKVGDDIVVIPAGKEVLIPVSGALKNNPELLNAAFDATRVFLGIFRIIGQVDTGKPSKMWEYEVALHKKTIARVGKYTLQQHNAVGVVETRTAAQLNKGDITDANGKPQASMVG